MDQDQTAAHVKAEPGEKEHSLKIIAKVPANELPILDEDELRKFRKEELSADVTHLQGRIFISKTLDYSKKKSYAPLSWIDTPERPLAYRMMQRLAS
jgi:hypothetical protein